MENGILYKVVYSDGYKDRVKTLRFVGKEGVLLEFFNPHKNIAEYINESKIIRMESVLSGDVDYEESRGIEKKNLNNII